MLACSLRLQDCWLEIRVHAEGPATGHVEAGFLVLLCPQANAEMVLKSPLQASHAALTF
jgi:hypothetical protein